MKIEEARELIKNHALRERIESYILNNPKQVFTALELEKKLGIRHYSMNRPLRELFRDKKIDRVGAPNFLIYGTFPAIGELRKGI